MEENINNIDFYGDFSGCEYYSSWNWLMPVVEKIESLRLKVCGFAVYEYFNVKFSSNMCTISSGLNNADGITKSPYYYNNTSFGENRLNVVWNAVVKFIKWYNIQKHD